MAAVADQDKVVLLAVALGSIFVIGASSRRFYAEEHNYSYSSFIDPNAVADIANSLPAPEDEFVIAAWGWVAQNIHYDNFGTVMYFSSDGIDCDNCLLPAAVIATGQSNCVGKAGLLTSILRNRIPADRVYMVVGRLRLNGVGGHAWVRVEEGGTWYILESTVLPPAQPWIPESTMAWKYAADGYVNDAYFQCYDPALCVAIHANCCAGGCYEHALSERRY